MKLALIIAALLMFALTPFVYNITNSFGWAFASAAVGMSFAYLAYIWTFPRKG